MTERKAYWIGGFLYGILAVFLTTGVQAAPRQKERTVSVMPGVQDQPGPVYRVSGELYSRRNGPFDFITGVPGDIAAFGKTFLEKDTVGVMVWVAIGTGTLVSMDGRLYERTAAWGRHRGISEKNTNYSLLDLKVPTSDRKTTVLEVPSSLGSALTFAGSGLFNAGIGASFVGYGMAKGDAQATETGWDIVEAMMTTGIVCLGVKMVTGREEPAVRTARNGKWHFFPNPVDYFKDTPRYDSFPSGGVATVVSTLTVISENYPDNDWVRPLGLVLVIPLGFQAVNSGGSWYGDFPLALFIGHTCGRVVVDKRRSPMQRGAGVFPEVHPLAFDGGAGVELRWHFPFRG